MYLQIKHGDFSRTIIKELNPLDIANFFGNIGGFWGTSRREQERSRDRTKAAKDHGDTVLTGSPGPS